MLLSLLALNIASSLALSLQARDWQPWNNPGLPACSAEVDGLISGIEINILGQQGERNATLNLQAIEAESPVDPIAFAAGKAVLVSNVLFGMTIRRYNQLIAPAGNAALPGLAKYASAQAVELALSQSLTGVPAHDLPILAMLVSDITTGISLNQNNTELAASGCSSPLLQYLPTVVADAVDIGQTAFISYDHIADTRLKLASIASPDIQAHGDTSLASAISPTQTPTRKRDASVAGLDASIDGDGDNDSLSLNGDQDDGDIDGQNSRKRPVKRACNECRQQKLRCDVVQDPWKTCSRCTRLNLTCKIDENFKRIGKRSRNAEMEREIVELRRQVAAQNANNNRHNASLTSLAQNAMHTNEAAAGLLDLRNDGKGGGHRKLGDVILHLDRIRDLFQRYFKFSHPFLPFLNPERPPEEYYARCPLLFWTIVLVGSRHYSVEPHLFASLARQVQMLVWSTIADVPQNYLVIKALILLCAWPLPCSSTSTDPTFMLAGMMMQIALQIGLHRPDHAQDFSKFRIEIRQAELQDRVVTWSVCNMVAQRVATAYGQPAQTIYDWTLGAKPIESNPSYELPKEIYSRLQIERFNDKVSKTIYTNASDPVGLPEDHIRSELVKVMSAELKELEQKLENEQPENSAITRLYLRSAALHLHLSAFFSHRDLPSYRTDMLDLYHATINLLETCLNLESEYSINLPSNYSHGLSLSHGTNYIFHMMLAAGFSLLKLMHHFLPQHDLDTQGASGLLTRTLWALRSASVLENDLAERLSEVLAQVWKSGPSKTTDQAPNTESAAPSEEPSDELQLKVRCRMSMSLVFDSVWRWRKNFRDQRPPQARFFKASGDGRPTDPTLAAAALGQTNLTAANAAFNNVSSSTNSNATSSSANQALTALSTPTIPGMAGMPTGIADDFMTDPYSSTGYDVFDPLNWMLDGTVDFPYSFQNTPGDPLKDMTVDIDKAWAVK